MNRLARGILMLASPPNLMASIIPVTLGFVAALTVIGQPTASDWMWFLLAIFAIILIELGKNTVNEYFDYKSGTDRFIDDEHLTPFSGGRRVLPSGILTELEVIYIGVVTFGVAILAGLIMAYFTTLLVLWIGIIGVAISILYTLPPIKLCYRGFGEMAVGIVYGPLIVMGSFALIAQQFTLEAFLISLPLCFMIANVLVINEFPDYEADKRAYKYNLVVLFGKERSVYIFAGLFALAYLSVLPIVIYTGNLLFLIVLLTMPVAVKACINCKKHYDDIGLLVASNKMTIGIHVLTGVIMIVATLST